MESYTRHVYAELPHFHSDLQKSNMAKRKAKRENSVDANSGAKKPKLLLRESSSKN